MAKYFGLKIDNDLQLIVPELSMTTEVYNLVDSDREHLRTFLDFVDSSTDATSQIDYFKMKMQGAANGTDKLFMIAKENKIIGCMDLHNIDIHAGKGEIGYWIHSDYTGKNIMTKAVNTMCRYSFDILGLNKLTIFADVKNIASNRVACKAHFKFVGVKVQDVIRYGKYRDMNEYYLLKADFYNEN